jgi:hypothetical protein
MRMALFREIKKEKQCETLKRSKDGTQTDREAIDGF